jgi:polyhydroxyalkanoate synthesis regulator phasin
MPQNDMLKRYLDAGLAFTQMTRDRAEAIVKDLVKAGEVQQKQAQKQVDDLVERSRKNTEALLEVVRREVTTQLSAMGLATRDDIARLEAMIGSGGSGTSGSGTSGSGAGAPGLVIASPAAAAAEAAEAAAPVKQAPAKKVAGPAKKAPAKKAAGSTKKA